MAGNRFGLFVRLGESCLNPLVALQSTHRANQRHVRSRNGRRCNSARNGKQPTAGGSRAVAPSANGYYVQVAAVSKQDDADALVDALKKKQYPTFSATAQPDKLFHVQVGPYADIKDAEAMRGKLVGDGYNPILKR